MILTVLRFKFHNVIVKHSSINFSELAVTLKLFFSYFLFTSLICTNINCIPNEPKTFLTSYFFCLSKGIFFHLNKCIAKSRCYITKLFYLTLFNPHLISITVSHHPELNQIVPFISGMIFFLLFTENTDAEPSLLRLG